MRWTRAGTESLAAAAIAAIIYGGTLAPTVGAGDSGELVLAADSLGIAHPPGYPLWVLLARLVALVPIGEVAWRVNALSALLSAAAVGLFYLLATRVALPRLPAAVATAFFAASRRRPLPARAPDPALPGGRDGRVGVGPGAEA